MIAKYLAVSTLLSVIGVNGQIPNNPQPLNAKQMQAKAKHKSVSDMCAKKRKAKKAQELCERWERHE